MSDFSDVGVTRLAATSYPMDRRDVSAMLLSTGLLCSSVSASLATQPGVGRALQKKLVDAYPSHLKGTTGTEIVWSDGIRMPWAIDLSRRTFDERLDNADLREQMNCIYRRGPLVVPSQNDDPGRFRYLPFFSKMYGQSASEVDSRLAEIIWAPMRNTRRRLKISRVNGISEILVRIGEELASLPKTLHGYFDSPAETYQWREIYGTRRRSMHSFGAAIDLNSEFGDYWESSPRISWHNRLPAEVVDVFERHKFIWGGRWFHYDTFHFEYRPELF